MKNHLSKEAFADWCEQQGNQSYDWINADECACAKYANYLGISGWLVHMHASRFWPEVNDLAMHRPNTFPALAARLRVQIALEGLEE